MGGFAARVLLRSTRFGAFGAKTENLTTPHSRTKIGEKKGVPPHSRQPDFPEINLVPIIEKKLLNFRGKTLKNRKYRGTGITRWGVPIL